MASALKSIAEYGSVGHDAFIADAMRQDAVICRLGVLGEAAKRVSEEFRMAHPEIPWRHMAGLRDVLVHNYFGVDLEILWGIIERELPELRRKIQTLTP